MQPTTGDATLDLVARVFQQALADARRGRRDAIEFLDVTAPDWRERGNYGLQTDNPATRTTGKSQTRARLHS